MIDPQTGQMNVDISKTTQMKCEHEGCENTTFNQVVEIRKMSALVSPSGQAAVIPVQLFACAKCGNVLDLERLQ